MCMTWIIFFRYHLHRPGESSRHCTSISKNLDRKVNLLNKDFLNVAVRALMYLDDGITGVTVPCRMKRLQ